jgi:hypothetical protein
MNRHDRRRQEAKRRKGQHPGVYVSGPFAAGIFRASLEQSGRRAYRESNDITDNITDIVHRRGFPDEAEGT